MKLASQSDAGDNPKSYTASYYHLKAGVKWDFITATLGYELLGSDDGTKLHSSYRWVQTMPSTAGLMFSLAALKDNSGLQDFYFDVTATVPGVKGLKFKAVWHDFTKDEDGGEDDLGSEIDLLALYKVPSVKGLTVGLKYAGYDKGDREGDNVNDVTKSMGLDAIRLLKAQTTKPSIHLSFPHTCGCLEFKAGWTLLQPAFFFSKSTNPKDAAALHPQKSVA